MKVTNNKTDSSFSILEKVQLFCLILFVCTLTCDTRINSAFLFFLLFSLLFSFDLAKLKKNVKPILFFTGVFVISLLSVAWSQNYTEGWKVIERQLALFFIPIMFFSSFNRGSEFARITLIFYYFSMLMVSTYLLHESYDLFIEKNVSFREYSVKEHLYHAFAQPVNMHATFLSLFVALAILLGFYWLLSGLTWWKKLLIFISLIILSVTLTLLSSRVVISSLAGTLFFVYPFFTGQMRSKISIVVAGLVVLATLLIIIRQSSFISDRFIEKIDDEIRLTPFLKNDSTYNPVYGGETRADRWYCAVELFRESPLIGYGTGSEKDVLILKYSKYNLENALTNMYDAHNQYLAFAIKSGVLGLIVFVASILYGFSIAIKRKHFLYLSFLLLFTVSCLTENVLESNKGIFFFSFFNVIIYFLSTSAGLSEALDKEESGTKHSHN